MRSIVILLTVSLILFFILGGFKWISEEILQPDRNPELVSFLQGDWTVANDNKSIIRIKRDSLFEINNDSISSVNRLDYLFYDAANKYFTTDSSFDFSSSSKGGLTTDFKLREVDEKLHDTIIHVLVYVSKSKVQLSSRGKTVTLTRLK